MLAVVVEAHAWFGFDAYDGGAAGVAVSELLEAVYSYAGALTDLQGQSIPKIIRDLAKRKPAALAANDPFRLLPRALQEGSELVLEVDFLKRRFLLGKALSGARPGEPFDLVLSGSASC